MSETSQSNSRVGVSRRDFVKTAAVISAGGLAASAVARSAHVRGRDVLRVGVIGAGGRGTGAAIHALQADPSVQVIAIADLFRDRLEGSVSRLQSHELASRVDLSNDRLFTGFDAYEKLLALDEVDSVILATPPHFRPDHFATSIKAGKHVFFEKPVGVDPAGIRKVLEAGQQADARGLKVVAGTQRRHDFGYRDLIKRIHDGQIGDVVTARCYWNQGGLWMHPRRPEWSDMEWQLRNWLYFTWLSGDHIVEQHVHNIDVCNWAIGSHPVKALGMGGRQVRTDEAYGNIFDHFAIEYDYGDGVTVTSMCRQIDGCAGRVDEFVKGTKGEVRFGQNTISGENRYRYDGEYVNAYVQEHADLVNAIRSGSEMNEARTVAESTLTAIMGRMSAYTGQEVTWEQALNSDLDLTPPVYEFGPTPVRAVAVPGKTRLV